MLIKTVLNHCQKFNSFVYKDVYFEENHIGHPSITVEIEARKTAKNCAASVKRPAPVMIA